MNLAISSCVIDLIHRASAVTSPHEACGLLFGTTARIDSASAVPNIAADPARHFEIDPAALFAALRAERAGGAALIGYWHSHPSGDPGPSAHDAAMAAPDGRLWLILGGATLTAWRAVRDGAVHGRFDPIDWQPV